VTPNWIKPWIPPAVPGLVSRIRTGPYGLRGQYPTWQQAVRHSTGYSERAMLSRIASTESVVNSGGQLHERDGALFDQPVTPYPLLSFLLRAAGISGRLTVLDFGGSLGSTYRQCAPFLSHLPQLRWNVVDQPQLVEVGRQRFTTDVLQFHSSIEEASPPDVVIFSGVLQLLDDPFDILARAVAHNPQTILIDRTSFSKRREDIISLRIVSDRRFAAKLPFRVFGAETIERALPNYRKIAEFRAIDPDMRAGTTTVHFLGKAFERP
jgi:putative methyltransferase (TIGR04325 family)